MRRSLRPALLAAGLVLIAAAAIPAGEPARAGPPPGGGPPAEAQRGAQARKTGASGARAARARRYRQMVRGWHRRPPRSVVRAWKRLDPRPLVLRPAGSADRFDLVPEADGGGFSDAGLALAREALRHDDGTTHPIHPRLVELVHRAVQRFEAPWVIVVSGYRPDRGTSRHAQGRAIDIALPGVSDRGLARYLAQQGFVGVGLYPRSGFVHLDVRDRSYIWIDRSGPGQRSRRIPMMRLAGARADANARRRGEEPVATVAAEEEEIDGEGAE